MTCLQRIRNTSWLGPAVALWFALFIAVATASAWVRPVASHMVCVSGAPMQLLADPADAAAELRSGMDCPLCAPLLAPPPPTLHNGLARLHARFASAAAAVPSPPLAHPPLPARGPPEMT